MAGGYLDSGHTPARHSPALRRRRARMPEYLAHARDIAAALKGLDWIRLLLDPPQTSMMHLLLEVTKGELLERGLAIAQSERIWTFAQPFAVEHPNQLRLELSVGDTTMTFSPDEVRKLLLRLTDGHGGRRP